jgi:hypothetical protein
MSNNIPEFDYKYEELDLSLDDFSTKHINGNDLKTNNLLKEQLNKNWKRGWGNIEIINKNGSSKIISIKNRNGQIQDRRIKLFLQQGSTKYLFLKICSLLKIQLGYGTINIKPKFESEKHIIYKNQNNKVRSKHISKFNITMGENEIPIGTTIGIYDNNYTDNKISITLYFKWNRSDIKNFMKIVLENIPLFDSLNQNQLTRLQTIMNKIYENIANFTDLNNNTITETTASMSNSSNATGDVSEDISNNNNLSLLESEFRIYTKLLNGKNLSNINLFYNIIFPEKNIINSAHEKQKPEKQKTFSFFNFFNFFKILWGKRIHNNNLKKFGKTRRALGLQ